MAAQQTERHELGREGQDIARENLGGEQQTHKAPFDIVDFAAGYAYEVKTMSALSADFKIHISQESYDRKMQYADEHHVHPYLIAVVIHSPDKVEVYRSELYMGIRVNQMDKIR